MANKAGRKTKLTEKEVNHLIYLYKTERQINGEIKYGEMYQFNKELVQKGRFPTAAGEDFWRKKNRLGRMMIDIANNVFTSRPSTSEFPNDNLPNLADIVNKYYDDKETLIRELIVIERKFYKNIERRKTLELKLTESEEKVQVYKSKLSDSDNRFEYLQDLLFKLLRYSSVKGVPLVNHLDTGNKQTTIVKKSLENIFSNPSDFYNWYEPKLETSENIKDNVIPLKKEKTLADEFSDIF
ncbi:hypothetical protein J2S13_000464 [Oikeobacillus pervagus]|uniref:Uncharacterized protein n=1 Tax=Oikeobacillus pervagus TaxID=1325931 RepID=A0AAJ1SWW7_9BACI|nr:hypothetical protein [Oikeobacillus pervagus]MDQ0214069.1 hypothetical protein [Oikeobacillus pervagus]